MNDNFLQQIDFLFLFRLSWMFAPKQKDLFWDSLMFQKDFQRSPWRIHDIFILSSTSNPSVLSQHVEDISNTLPMIPILLNVMFA